MEQATRKAIDCIGGVRATARAMDVLPGSVSYWLRAGRVPAERVLALEAACEAQVTRYELRPDIYPR